MRRWTNARPSVVGLISTALALASKRLRNTKPLRDNVPTRRESVKIPVLVTSPNSPKRRSPRSQDVAVT